MIALILIAYLLIRVGPYFLSSVPLGYDPGLYLYLFRTYSHFSPFAYTSLPTWIQEVYPPLLPFVVRLTSSVMTPEQILIPLVLLAALALFCSLYYLMNNLFDKKAAMTSVLLLSLSIIQYRFYWYYYVKNIFAASLLLCLVVLMKKKSRLAWIVAPAIILLHQPTAILMVILLLSHLIFAKERRFGLTTIGITILTFIVYYIPNYQVTILPFLPSFMKSLLPAFLSGNFGQESGTFYKLTEAFWYFAMYLPFAIYTIWKGKLKANKELVILLLFSFIFSAGVFLSRRFIPFLDLLLIIFAATSISKIKIKFVIPYFIILALIFSRLLPSQSKTLIAIDEFSEIKLLSTTEPDAYVLVADNEYTPWIYGYSMRKPIAPGFGEYDLYWSFPEWDKFWESGDRQVELDLLKKLPKPLYIYLGDRQRQISFRPEGECFTRFSWHVYKFECE